MTIKKRIKKKLPAYTYLGCKYTLNNSPWCYGLCTPDNRGKGRCGRISYKTVEGRTTKAIREYNESKIKA